MDAEYVKSASVYGAGIHVLADSRLNMDGVKNNLTANNILVHSIKKVKPSLEDVFVFLVEKEKAR